jgi:hypothetical protein
MLNVTNWEKWQTYRKAALLPMHTHLIYHIAATQQAPSIIQLADVNGIVVEETTYVST